MYLFSTNPKSFKDRDDMKLSKASSGGATPLTLSPCLSRTCKIYLALREYLYNYGKIYLVLS